MEKQQFLKLLLDIGFYEANKHNIVDDMFPDMLALIWKALKDAHAKFNRTLIEDELSALIFAANPNLTRAQRENIHELFEDIKRLPPVGKDVAAEVLKAVYREEIGRRVSSLGIDLATGKASITAVRDFVDSVGDSFVPNEYPDPTTTDVNAILEALDRRAQWAFNIPTLAAKIPGLCAGEFMVTAARPETGKTAHWVSFAVAPGGWCHQGAKVHVIVNEEPSIRTMMRAISSCTGLTKDEIRINPAAAAATWSKVSQNLTVVDDVSMTMERLDAYCKHYCPDILVLDQIDKLGISGNFARKDERLGEIYQEGRAIAKRRGLALVALTQASAAGEGKTQIDFSMMADSKTSKAAEADLVIGIGMPDNPENPTRYLHASKNKISGWHGTLPVMLDGRLSRYTE